MVRTKNLNEIILNSLDFFRTKQPKLNIAVGSVARDLFIEGQASQLASFYQELNTVSVLQNPRTARGAALDKWAQNVGAVRNQSTKSTVSALLTFSSIDGDIAVNRGDIITAKNGATFTVSNSIVVSSIFATNYKSIASKYKNDLDYVGITDQYAVEVNCEATAPGVQGNISKYYLRTASIVGVSNVTNVFPGSGGSAVESDDTFLQRVLAIFSGANVGTAVGYRNAVKADPNVIDAVVIEPGDDLMTRDGTQVIIAEDGSRTIVSEGTGGKVDIITFGTRYQENTDSYVYHDKSNTNESTNSLNNYILGQIPGDENKTVTRKRIDNLSSGTLPSQPINNIVSVSGSSSGPNFAPRSVDELGRVTGNYVLEKDTGVYAGSPWAFDKLKWISNYISNLPEDKTKGVFNGQDPLNYTDIIEIKNIQQNIIVTNENSTVTASDRRVIQLKHKPVSTVTRVFNVTTGDRYVVTSQNPDGVGTVNFTGRILITGKSLPAVSDLLQVDYTWVYSFDPYFDFDNRVNSDNPRSVQDSIDWGYSNLVRNEYATLLLTGSYLTFALSQNISSIINASVFEAEDSEISLVSGRLAVIVSESVINIVSIKRISDDFEVWNTSTDNGSFNAFTIYLPTDTIGEITNEVRVIYNTVDIYNTSNPGSFNGKIVSIVPSVTATAGTQIICNYISDTNNLISSNLLASYPALRNENSFSLTNIESIGTQPTTHIYNSDGSIHSNIRLAPSCLGFLINGTISPGVLTASGTTFTQIFDYVYTVGTAGLTIDVISVLKKYYDLNSKQTLSENIFVASVNKIELVTTNSNLDVLSSDYVYDIKGYTIYNNSFDKENSHQNNSLKKTEITLPSTLNNAQNIPQIGSRIRIRIHVATLGDSENVSFTKSGIQYTNKKFAIVDTISISSGFLSSTNATLAVNALNQPLTKSRYRAFYDYIAPKSNERITIVSNYDRIITDATLSLEQVRPINADVLIKKYTPLLVDVIMYIVVTKDSENSSEIVKQNVQDAILAALNAQELNTTIDQSDLQVVAGTVSGVDRSRIYYFNKTGSNGSVLSITAAKNEAITANNVQIILEVR